MKDLSIIIPVYNVENYIRACLGSVFRQNLEEDSFEVVVVDDGSEDESVSICERIIEHNKDKSIKIIHQENQ